MQSSRVLFELPLTQSRSAELKKIIMVKQFSAYAALAGLIAAVSARPTARSTEAWGQLRENVSDMLSTLGTTYMSLPVRMD